MEDGMITKEQARELKKALHSTAIQVDWENGTDITEIFYQVVDSCVEVDHCTTCTSYTSCKDINRRSLPGRFHGKD